LTTPKRWTGHEARLLRTALRMSVRTFAAYLGVAERTVSTWEKAGRKTEPWPHNQAILDTALTQAGDEAQARFTKLIKADAALSDTSDRGASSIESVAWAADSTSARAAAVALWAAESPDTPVDGAMQTASHSAILKWLLARHGDDVTKLPPRDDSRQVTGDDVAALQAMKRSLAALDDEHGGGAALPLTLKYLSSEVAQMLHGCYSERRGRELFVAAAELTLRAGWMAYDAGQHGHARKQMLHALRLSQVAGDRLFGGRVLAAMSHQALHIGQLQDGIDFAAAATQGAQTEGLPAAVALFASSEARALAVSGAKQTCLGMMRTAERALNKARPADGPE
jgi:transcriptional regulator with XRE-family HTH domain